MPPLEGSESAAVSSWVAIFSRLTSAVNASFRAVINREHDKWVMLDNQCKLEKLCNCIYVRKDKFQLIVAEK